MNRTAPTIREHQPVWGRTVYIVQEMRGDGWLPWRSEHLLCAGIVSSEGKRMQTSSHEPHSRCVHRTEGVKREHDQLCLAREAVFEGALEGGTGVERVGEGERVIQVAGIV